MKLQEGHRINRSAVEAREAGRRARSLQIIPATGDRVQIRFSALLLVVFLWMVRVSGIASAEMRSCFRQTRSSVEASNALGGLWRKLGRFHFEPLSSNHRMKQINSRNATTLLLPFDDDICLGQALGQSMMRV